MWDLFQTIRHRHSVRQYQKDVPIEKEKLHAILETLVAAPSAGDLQSYRVVVVEDAAQRQALSDAAEGQRFIAAAPVCLVFCTDAARAKSEFGERGETLYAIQDATIAASYAQLAIVAAGLASTWVGNFDSQQLKDILKLEAGLEPVVMLSLGYAAELPEPTHRRPLDEVIIYR